jgi:hypothetical protein
MTRRELDELAYLLHANVQRGDYERLDNPANVEERKLLKYFYSIIILNQKRIISLPFTIIETSCNCTINHFLGMREMWSQMSNQKKNSYYKRVIQIYKRPNRDVVITSSSSTIGNKSIFNYLLDYIFFLENNSLSPNDFIDNTNPSSLISMNPLSIELKRQTSTPLSFHSIASSKTDDSPDESTSKTNIFTDIVNELIKGAKGLDKLSCTPTVFVNSIHNFVRSTIDKQNQIITNLERQVEQ